MTLSEISVFAWLQRREKKKKEFLEKINFDEENFAQKYGELGPVYGEKWRNFGRINQLEELIEKLKSNSFSRRHILSTCHLLTHFFCF